MIQMPSKVLLTAICTAVALNVETACAGSLPIWLQGAKKSVSIGDCVTDDIGLTPNEVILPVAELACRKAQNSSMKNTNIIGDGFSMFTENGPLIVMKGANNKGNIKKQAIGECKAKEVKVATDKLIIVLETDLDCRNPPPAPPPPVIQTGCGQDVGDARCFHGDSMAEIYVRQLNIFDKSIQDGVTYVVWFDPYAGGPDVYWVNQYPADYPGEYQADYDVALSRIPESFEETLDEYGEIVDIPPACISVGRNSTGIYIVDHDTIEEPGWQKSNEYCGLIKGANYYLNLKVHGTPNCGGRNKACGVRIHGKFPTQ